MAHTSGQQSPVWFDADGHVHFTDPERERFANAVDAFGRQMEQRHPELSDQLDEALELSIGSESVDKLNRFGEEA
jgi:hypothetical protein